MYVAKACRLIGGYVYDCYIQILKNEHLDGGAFFVYTFRFAIHYFTNTFAIGFKYIRMGLLKEFKEFAVKGNMMDMAIGIIIGASFNSIVNVLVKQVLMPPLSLLSGGINLKEHRLVLREAYTNTSGALIEEVAIAYGALAEAMLDFLIIGFTIFIVVKGMNRLRNKAQNTKDVTVATPKDIELLSNLKELMEEQNALLKATVVK